jgi:hypothetical protein
MMSRIDLNNASHVAELIAELRLGDLTLMIVPSEVADVRSDARSRGHSSLWAAADNIIDVRDGKVTFLKRRNA